MAPKIIIYGATGYTGGLIADEAKEMGLEFVIAGRTEHKIKSKADSLSVPYRVFSLDGPQEIIDRAMGDMAVLINCAGPFTDTSGPFMDACIRNHVHYIDMTTEAISYISAESRDQAAKDAGVILLPGGGGVAEVFMDCLIGHVVDRTKDPVQVDQLSDIVGPVSRGTVGTIRTFTAESMVIRENGKLTVNAPTNTVDWDMKDGRGTLKCNPSCDPQVYTIWKALGIPNIKTYIIKSAGDIPTGPLETIPEGPTREERDAAPYIAAAKAIGADGTVNHSVIRMKNGYTITAEASARAAKILAYDDMKGKTGWQTPLMVFGSDYPLTFPGTTIEDL